MVHFDEPAKLRLGDELNGVLKRSLRVILENEIEVEFRFEQKLVLLFDVERVDVLGQNVPVNIDDDFEIVQIGVDCGVDVFFRIEPVKLVFIKIAKHQLFVLFLLTLQIFVHHL